MDQQILYWAQNANFAMIAWAPLYLKKAVYIVVIGFFFFGIAPMSFIKAEGSIEAFKVLIRKILLYTSYTITAWLVITGSLFEFTNVSNDPNNMKKYYYSVKNIINPKELGIWVVVAIVSKIVCSRYVLPYFSSLTRSLRNLRSKDQESDIRDEKNTTKMKSFNPKKYYKKNNIFIALNESNKPIYVPIETWRKTNMQIIGPTRYGKGVAIGVVADQVIKKGDSLIYIDPKSDEFISQIMYQASLELNRPFLYLTLHDNGIGYYSPFKGGSERDALSRLTSAFGLEMTGNAGTDYYKTIEREYLTAAFKKGRSIKSLLNTLTGNEKASRTNAEISAWSEVKTLCPSKKSSSFSIEKALLDGAIIYVQGKLDDPVVKTATKVFIREIIQESKRLVKKRTNHLTVIVDEVSFLVSKTLAEALSTTLADNVNFVLAYQSIDDLLNLDDATVNPRYINQNINVNCQLKLVYGGKDFPTAEWVAKMSGTVTKAVTRIEKTDVSHYGGEQWEDHRQISNVSENLISTNQILSLPPQVACLIQPNQLATLAYTSFVSVKDTKALPSYLAQFDNVIDKPVPEKILTKPMTAKSKPKSKISGKNEGKDTSNSDKKTPKASVNNEDIGSVFDTPKN